MKEEKIDKWQTPSSLIPNRGDIDISLFRWRENSKHGRAVVPSQRGWVLRGEGSRKGWKLQTNRSVQHFMKVEYSLKEERIGWWEGPLLTLPGQLNVNHVRDKNYYWMSSLKGISGSSPEALTNSPHLLLSFLFVCFLLKISCCSSMFVFLKYSVLSY